MRENNPIPPAQRPVESDAGTTVGFPPGAGRARITAASFRALTARVKRKTLAPRSSPEAAADWLQIPEIFEPPRAEAASLPAVAAPEMPAARPEVFAPKSLSLWDGDSSNAPVIEIAIPAFEPLASIREAPPERVPEAISTEDAEPPDAAPVEPSPSPETPADVEVLALADFSLAHSVAAEAGVILTPELLEPPVETIEAAAPVIPEDTTPVPQMEVPVEEPPPVPVETEPAAELQTPQSVEVVEAVVEAPAPAPEEPEPAEVAAQAEEIVAAEDVSAAAPEEAPAPAGDADEVMKALTSAIYSKPTRAERVAFLRDVAAMIESEAGADSLVAAAIVSDAVPPLVSATMLEPAADSITDSLASRLGPAQTLLRKAEDRSDPFASTSRELSRPFVERPPGDEESGAHALSLLDMMASTSGAAQPQERALAADTLLHLIPRVPARQLLSVVERLAIMESPPALVVAKLIRDPRAEIVAPLIERCTAISDRDLIAAAAEGDAAKRRIIARRRHVSVVLSDTLIATADASVMLTLIRNPAANFSHDAFHILAEKAARNHNLLAPLATRNDLPAPVAFELFWYLPSELRRYVLSRFLTDSETLNKILKITRAAGDTQEAKFPSREMMERVTDAAFKGQIDAAARIMSEAGAIDFETAQRILSDREGEPLAVALKAMGLQRSKLGDVLASLKSPDSGVLRADRNTAELENIFDTLSFNKARTLLTYWDWFVLRKGPYAPHH